MGTLSYHFNPRGVPGYTRTITQQGATDPAPKTFTGVIPAVSLVDTDGNPVSTSGAASSLPAGTDRSGTATTTSGGLNVPANSARTFLVGQNTGTVNIGFNEFGGTAAIGSAGTYTVPAGSSFSISTNRLVNFIAASGTVAVTMSEG